VTESAPAPRPFDPDLVLQFAVFDIPDLRVLRAVMVAEQKAVLDIKQEVRNLAANASTPLVDPQGKPIPLAAGNIAGQIRALTVSLLVRPVLSAGYKVAPISEGGAPDLVAFEPAGLKLAFLTYQGLGMLIQAHIGPNIAQHLGSMLDRVVVFTLQAALRHRNPYRVIQKALVFKAKDAATGAPVLAEPEWADEVRRKLSQLVVVFLLASEYTSSTLGVRETEAAVLTAGEEMPELSLTAAGEQLYRHLSDQLALKATMMQRGNLLTEQAAAAGPETKTQSEVERDLANPNANPHES
jgi:hypothetical protein